MTSNDKDTNSQLKALIYFALTFIVCCVLWVATDKLSSGGGLVKVDTRGYPRAVIAVTGLLAFIGLVQSFIQAYRAGFAFNLKLKPFLAYYYRPIILFVMFGIYVYSLTVFHFLYPTLILMLLSQAFLLGVNSVQKILLNIVLTLGITFGVYALFIYGLNITLP